jgi:hypothetical protein
MCDVSQLVLGIGLYRASLVKSIVLNSFETEKPKKLLYHTVSTRSVKTVVQSDPKPCRALVGPCRPKPG